MKTRFLLITLACTALLLGTNCKEEKSIYEDCCGASPTADLMELDNLPPQYAGQKGAVYVPNIFLSGDPTTLDNLFMVFGNELVYLIKEFKCTGTDGSTLFVQYDFQPSDTGFGWTGELADGSFYYGPFNYSVTVRYINQLEKTLTGKACAVKCNAGDFPAQNLPDCFFPGQNNGNGQPDQTLASPQECF
ncbi:MAG: hypothetical protein IPM98_01740 [Lewinellaceae bacterium]|nr:hypothetical protein [Lewinellaceae bacterium]